MINNCTRECLALVADTSLSGARVVRELGAVIRQRGRPDTIVSDNSTEYTSNVVLAWADHTGAGWHYIAPGKPLLETSGGLLRWLRAAQAALLPTQPISTQINFGLSSWLDEKRGHVSARCLTRCSASKGNGKLASDLRGYAPVSKVYGIA